MFLRFFCLDGVRIWYYRASSKTGALQLSYSIMRSLFECLLLLSLGCLDLYLLNLLTKLDKNSTFIPNDEEGETEQEACLGRLLICFYLPSGCGDIAHMPTRNTHNSEFIKFWFLTIFCSYEISRLSLREMNEFDMKFCISIEASKQGASWKNLPFSCNYT